MWFFKRKRKHLNYTDFTKLLKENKEIHAIWQNKDHDAPVIIIGYYGQYATETHYVRVKGSSTGIPLDEILF
jgi:hypothetical protein